MAYPTASVDASVSEIDRIAREVKQYAQRVSAASAAGSITSTAVFDVVISIRRARVRLADLAAVPGVKERAAAQKNTPELDVTQEFPAMLTAMDNVVAWVTNNFPRDASGFLLSQTLGADGPVDRMFSPASTASFRTQLDALAGTID